MLSSFHYSGNTVETFSFCSNCHRIFDLVAVILTQNQTGKVFYLKGFFNAHFAILKQYICLNK